MICENKILEGNFFTSFLFRVYVYAFTFSAYSRQQIELARPFRTLLSRNEPLNTPVLVEFQKSTLLSHTKCCPESVGTVFVLFQIEMKLAKVYAKD